MKTKMHRIIKTKTRTFLLCFTIMFLFSSFFLGMYCHLVIQKEIQMQLNSSQSKFEQSVRNFQEEFRKIQEFASQLSETGWFKGLLYKRAFDEQISEGAYELHQSNIELKAYTLLNSFMETVFIYFPERGYTLSSIALFYDGKIPENIFCLENIPKEEWEEMTSTRNVSRYVPGVEVSRNKRRETGMLYLTSYPFNNPSIRANLVIYISDEKMREQINPDLLDHASFLIVRNGEILWGDGEGTLPEELPAEEGVQRIGDIWYFTKGEGIQKYYMEVPKEILDVSYLYLNFVFYYVVLLVLCVGAAGFLSKRIYYPLKHILESALIPMDYDATMNEYRWLEKEIGALVEKESVLRKKVEAQKPLLMNAVLETVLFGSREEEEFEKLMALLGVSFPYRGYQVLTVEYQGELVHEEVEKIIRQLPQDICAVYYIFLKDMVALIVNAEGREVFERIQSILYQSFAAYQQMQGSAYGAGKTVWSAIAVNSSFRQAVRAGKYCYFSQDAGFLEGTEFERRSEYYELSELEKKGMLCDLKNRQEEEALKKLEEILDRNAPRENLTPEAAKKLLGELWNGITDFEAELELQREGPCRVLAGKDYDSDVESLKRHLYRVGKEIEEKYDAGGQKPVGDILGFVDSNMYNSELSLQMVAEQFGYTAAYTSRIFKEYFNKNFLEYVMDGRIRKAKELLELTNLPIKEIAEKTGFGSDITFRRVFKKETGMIPSNYRSFYQK